MSIELHKIYKRKKSDRDIFQELMPFKIKEILLIANYYDAYTIEREGQFTDKIVGEYLQVNLYTAPRFTSVASEAEALKILSERHIDLIILMAGLDKQTPLVISRHLKDLYPNICQLMLVNNNSDLAYFHTIEDRLYESIERLFVWNGSTKIFLVMAKYIEDKMNLDRDTHLGDIRVILLVENSIRYYSRYLPLLYTEVMTQTQELIFSEPQDNDMSIVMKIRVRPKVILATNYEEAVYVIDHYRENLIGVISDVRYKRNGEEDEEAGIELIRYVKRTGAYIPCMLQSQEIENTVKAEELHAAFINKNSPTLAHDIQDFIKGYLGFGDFIFRNKNGEPIDRATSIEEFKQKLLSIPDESLIYHSIRNGISTWLMAHREITLAKHLKRYRFEDFPTPAEMRQFILRVFEAAELKKIKGRIINYNPKLVDSNRYITRLGKGSFGGKGRGMAFLSNFIENVDFKKLIPKLKIEIPKTAIIGVDEFDNFIDNNGLSRIIYSDESYEEVKAAFIAAPLSQKLRDKLRSYLEVMRKPLAVRSSGLFEDSLSQPFAGVYSTYLIPNNHPDIERRIDDLETAVKLVYSSIFTDSSRAYFHAIDCMIEEEKMAVILQEVVGNEYNGKYYYFATFTNNAIKIDTVKGNVIPRRASHILVSDKPDGPYKPMKDPTYLPANMPTLDGTFWVDSDGKPYMIYCHEWLQNWNGTMEKIELKPDLSGSIGKGKILFRASDSPWSREKMEDKVLPNRVTDGPWLFRTGTGRLGMIWTSWVFQDYTQGVAYSESGTLDGPWIQEKEPITPPNFGHGMLFRTLDGEWMMSVHSHKDVNGRYIRIPHLFKVDLSGDKLKID